MARPRQHVLLGAAVLVLLAGPMSASWAAGASAATEAVRAARPGSPEAVYRHERDKCLSGRTHQDRATCLREAGAALAEARRGALDSGVSEQQLLRNRLLRCQAHPESERPQCERMVRGEGTVAGSVEQGAILRELVTRTVEPQPLPPRTTTN